MKLEDVLQPPSALSSGRFFRTGYLPTYSATVFVLVLLWAGAPGRPVDFGRAWRVADHFGVAQTLLVALAVALVTVLFQPFQLQMVRVLEGRSPWFPGAGLGRRAQLRRKGRLADRVRKKICAAVDANGDERNALIQEAGALSARLRSRFPLSDHLVRPTALGNALTAIEDSAGAPYGLDAVVALPRLYPLLGDTIRAEVDDLRDSLDAAARLAVTGAVTAVVTVALLAWHSGFLTLLALIPLALTVLGYAGSVQAAVDYGAKIQVAFDLHRFDLLNALHMKVPRNQAQEQASGIALSDFLRQGVPVRYNYAEPILAVGPAQTPGRSR